MNSADICHQISDCPGLFIDAFRGHFLREETKNPDATFILSHYHGDHYQNLQREQKYRGPAKIHCTPVTARLLRNVHQVRKEFVVEHEYGSTFRHLIVQQQKKRDTTIKGSNNYANITFYDANHCPGACIILIELEDGETTHLHTGDMRYHPRFQSYPLLSKSTKQRKLDLVYLDTTYCHPKHDFLAQEDAVDSIASQTQQVLSGNSHRDSPQKALVLLSCYSIGKEKVLYEASKRSKQLIYVSEKKWKMLECIQEGQSKCKNHSGDEQQLLDDVSLLTPQQHSSILERCTRDPSASDLHVIPMGLAGEIWPYFQPNFQKLAKYVEDISTSQPGNGEDGRSIGKEYDKVVAFIPTGWADATNWNKKNAVSTKLVQLSSSRSLHVEVRLISYSEHSTFPELVTFIQYLKPRKIIPTVYSDQSHKRQIEGRFRNMLDSTRAKQAFFRSMTKKKSIAVSTTAIPPDKEESFTANEGESASRIQVKDRESLLKVKDTYTSILDGDANKNIDDNDEIAVLCVVPAKKSSSSSASKGSSSKEKNIYGDKIDMIVSMGFERQRAAVFIKQCNGNMQQAIDEILSKNVPASGGTNPTKHQNQVIDTKLQLPHPTAIRKRKISEFFVPKRK